MATASKGYLAISKETTGGTAIATPTRFYPVEEAEFSSPNDMQDIREIRGSRQAFSSFDGAMRPTATFRGAVYPAGAFGSIMYGLFGAKAAALISPSTTAYLHTFSDGASLPYYTLELSDARSGEGGVMCQRLAGAKVESVSFSAAFGEKLDMTTNWQAMKKRTTASPIAAGSVIYPATKALIFNGATVEVDDVANLEFKSVQFEFRNTLMREEVLNGTQEAVAITEGGMETTLSANMRFTNLTMFNNFINNTELKLKLSFASATLADAATTPDAYFGMTALFHTVRIADYKNVFTAGEIVEADVEFKVLFNTTENEQVRVTITNLDATTVYNT